MIKNIKNYWQRLSKI